MDKIGQLHLDAIIKIEYDPEDKQPNYVGFAEECSKVTEQIALEFYEWADTSEEADNFWRNNKVSIDMDGSHNDIIKESRRKLFQLFLKTKQ